MILHLCGFLFSLFLALGLMFRYLWLLMFRCLWVDCSYLVIGFSWLGCVCVC